MNIVEVIVMVVLGLYLSMIGYKMHRLSLSILSGIITWFLVKYFTYDMGNISTSICILSGVAVFILSYLLKKINFYIVSFLFGAGLVAYIAEYIIKSNLYVGNNIYVLYLLLIIGGFIGLFISTYIFDKYLVFIFSISSSSILSLILVRLLNTDSIVLVLLIVLMTTISYVVQTNMYLDDMI